MSRVLFVVDGGGNIGLGHIVRCVSLGEAFRTRGWEVLFFSGIPEGVRVIHNKVFDTIQPRWEGAVINPEKAPLIGGVLQTSQYDVIVVDGYSIDNCYFDALKRHSKRLLYIDDLNVINYPVDYLVNGNAGADLLEYPQGKSATVYLLGLKYNLVRSHFANLPKREIHKSVKDILITTGGSDPLGHCLGITRMVSKYVAGMDVQIHVVIGNAFKSVEEFRIIQKLNPAIHLYEGIEDMRSLMISADIAISAGGGTLYELCACGVPTLTYAMVDNQTPVVEALKALGCVKDFEHYDDDHSERLIRGLQEIIDNFELRKNLSRNGQNLVDGRGAMRIVETVEKSI